MGKKSPKAPAVDKAAPVLHKPMQTDVEKVQATRSTTQSMQASASWSAASDVQAATKVWNTAADSIEANAKVIAQLKDQLKTAESKQRTYRRDWRAARAQVLGSVNVFCAGSADAVKAFNFDVRSHAFIGAQAAPENLTVASGKDPGDATASWSRGTAHHGFVVQYATDVATPASYSALTPCTKTKYTVSGLPSGSNVHFRIAAVDPTSKSGIGPWCAWAAGTAR